MLASLAPRFGPYSPPPPTMYRLTPRQRELAELLMQGRTIVVAARELGMTVATARYHVKAIALRLPNPHGLPALRLIQSYATVVRSPRY